MTASIQTTTTPFMLSGLTIATVLSFLLGACGSPFPVANTTTVSTYLLEWEAPASMAPENRADPSLLISIPLSSAGFDTTQMVYVEEPHRLNAFVRHRWVDTPARMLEPLLQKAAEQSGLFSAVTNSGARVASDLRLDTQLLRLQQVFSADSSEVQLALRVSLIDTTAARLLATEIIEVRKPTTERTPYAGVLAANQAVSELLRQLQAFLARQLCRDPKRCR